MTIKIATFIIASLLPVTALAQEKLLQSPLYPNVPPLNVYLQTNSGRDSRIDMTVIYRPDGTYDLTPVRFSSRRATSTGKTAHGQWWFDPTGKFCFMGLEGHLANEVFCRRNRLIGTMRFDGTNAPLNEPE